MHLRDADSAAPPAEPCPACGAAAPPGAPACRACGEPLAADLDALPLPPLPDGGLPAVMPDWLRDEAPPHAGREDPAPPTRSIQQPVPTETPPAAVGEDPSAKMASLVATEPADHTAQAPAPPLAEDDPAAFLTADDLPAWLRAIAAGDGPAAQPGGFGAHAASASAAQVPAPSRPLAPPAVSSPTPGSGEPGAPLYLPRAVPSLPAVATTPDLARLDGPPLAARCPAPGAPEHPAPSTQHPAPMQEGVAAGLATLLILFLAAVVAVVVWRAYGGW